MDSLFDTLTQASADLTDPAAEVPYLFDEQYHQNAYMIESALRQLGVLPSPSGVADLDKPYDLDLRKLIESVPVE